MSATTATRIRWAFRLLILLVGAFEVVWFRHDMNPDGISYLDLSDAILAGDWSTAVNPYWSPGYPVLLAKVRWGSPGPEAEFLLCHLAQFFCLVFALVSFEFLLREWTRSRRDPGGAAEGTRWVTLLAYPLFAWMALDETGIPWIGPDLLMAGFLLLACAQVLRIGRGVVGVRAGAALGLVLGLGFLAKAPMLPIGLFVLLPAAITAGSPRRALATAGPAAGVMMLIVAGWALALSVNADRFTWGDTGRLNYAWHVNGVEEYAHALEVAPYGSLAHPPRRVLESPGTFEFDSPVAGTYPLWLNASWWHVGVEPRFELDQQIAAVRTTLGQISRETLVPSWPLLAVLALYLLLAGGASALRRAGTRLARTLPLWLPALAGLSMYLLVRVEARYVAVLVLLLCLTLLDLAPSRPRRPRRAMVLGVLTLVLASGTVLGMRNRALRENEGDEMHRVAAALPGRGIRPGDPVAVVGNAFRAYWARLGRLRITADVPIEEEERFWALPPAGRARVLEAFERTGCVAVFGRRKHPPEGWSPLGDSSVCFRMLR